MHTDPEVLALVALGERESATPEELDHIAHCPACEREVTELGHLSQVGRSISDHYTLETPSPQVWERIRAQLGVSEDFSSALVPPATSPTRPAPAAAPQSPSGAVPAAPTSPIRVRIDPPRPTRKRRALGLALAFVLAVLAGVGGTIAWQQLTSSTDTVITSAPLQALPDWSGATGVATLEEDGAGNDVLVITMVTPRPVDGIQQVWLADSTATSMTPIGPLTVAGQRIVLPKGLDIDKFPLVDISVQQPGEVAHSGNSIVRGVLDV